MELLSHHSDQLQLDQWGFLVAFGSCRQQHLWPCHCRPPARQRVWLETISCRLCLSWSKTPEESMVEELEIPDIPAFGQISEELG
jgi:hypothetical protein